MDTKAATRIATTIALIAVGCGDDDFGDVDTTEVDAGDPAHDGGPAPDAGVGEEDAGVTNPTVIGTTPAEGAMDVFERQVSIQFSEPMNQGSVEAALSLGSAFVWTDGGATVTFEYGFPFGLRNQAHTLTLPTSVTNLDGVGLAAPFDLNVTLAARRTVILEYDPSLTGNCADCTSGGSFLQFGDTTGDGILYGGISFGLARLPNFDSVLDLESATYRSQVINTVGDPGAAAVGGALVDRVGFAARATIDTATLFSDDFATLFTTDSPMPGDQISVDVAGELATAWSTGFTEFQLRFEPANVTTDGVSDLIRLRRGADENDGIVAEGLPEPDEGNRSRIEVTYFASLDCDDECATIDDTQCATATLQRCVLQDDGCNAWVVDTVCGDVGLTCIGADGTAACSGFGDCINNLADDVCLPDEFCIVDSPSEPMLGVCTDRTCAVAADCPPSPPGGDAPIVCTDINGDMVSEECALDCSSGQTCPNGMSCFMSSICVWG